MNMLYTSCDCSYMSLYHSRNEKKKKNQIKENR